MSDWTAKNIPDQTGKLHVITGSNIGLGYEAALMLAEKGATVVLAVRTMSKGQTAAEKIKQAVPNADIHVMHLDLSDLSSVQTFAQEFNEKFDKLDVLMNNAGVMATPPLKTKDGFEMQLGTNHLGHFALTGQLLPKLLATPGSRIVNVSSMAANSGEMHFDDLMLEEDYGRVKAYSQSKLANLLFTIALDKRLKEANANTLSLAAHPGGANTNLANSTQIKIPLLLPIMKLIFRFMAQDAHTGALSQVRAAVEPDISAGDYYGPHNGMKGLPALTPMPEQVNEADAETLWQRSEALTGITYPL